MIVVPFGLGGKALASIIGSVIDGSFSAMKLPSCTLGVVLLTALLPVSAEEWVSASEVLREAEYQARSPEARPRTRALSKEDPEAPLIEVIRPNPLNNLKQPFPVELRFTARSGAPIDPKSLKVSYGFMGLDLTERIRKSATVTPEGLRAENVEIPKGEHRLTVRVADARGLVGERDIRIKVGE